MYHVGLLELELHFPTSHSLKDKRSLLRGPIERVRDRLNISIIEIAGRDGWQRATVAATCIASDDQKVRQMLDKVAEHFERADGVVLLENRIEML